MKLFFIWSLFIGKCYFAFAQQQQIQGKLTTRAGRAVAYANVVIKDKENNVVGFKASDAQGNFVVLLPDTVNINEALLEIRHLGYKTVSISLAAMQKYYPVILEEQSIDLSEVEVKNRPRIRRRGDTLSYEVSSFAKNEDRSIGDVLKRMPGVEVGENGEIKYNGKSISNFYIDGDDLLNDRYAIGSKTIPHDMVKGVEILQNHQPIKVLQDQVLSDQVALNLVIKEEAKLKLSGQAKIGLGLPHQYDSELNTILFNKKYKMLNVLKGNNVGDDLSADFMAFNRSSFLSAMDNGHPDPLLSLGTVGAPGLPKNRYYFNQSGSLNANNLVNLKSEWQLKANIHLLLDKNRMEYGSINDLYLENDTIHYSEQQALANRPFLTALTLSAEANKAQYYFRNRLRLAYSGETADAQLQSNQDDLVQQLHNRISDFSNHLEYVPKLKNKNVVRLDWYLNYFSRPQHLHITPGINADILHDSVPYASTDQSTETPTWFNKFSMAYGLVNRKIKQHYRIGLMNEIQQLQAALRLREWDGQVPYAGSKDNDLHWNRHRWYADATYVYKQEHLEASLLLPLIGQLISYRDAHFDFSATKRQLLFNPSLELKFTTNVEDYLSMNYSYNNQVGNINDVYRGAVLVNYRTIQANNAELQETSSHNAGIAYNFQRSIMMLFMNAGLSWSKGRANAIASSFVNDNISQTVLLPLKNDVSTLNAYLGVSKYIFALGATTAIKASWNSTRYNQLLNNQLIPYHNISFSLSPSMEARLWERIALRYNAVASWITSKLIAHETMAVLPRQGIQQYDQSMQLTVSFWKNLFLTINGRHQLTKQGENPGYFFIDANVRLRINKTHSDIELNLNNLANVKNYETYRISANSFWYSHYALRGRMAVLKIAVSF